MSLEQFSVPVAEWFQTNFPAPTAAQTGAWGPISRGEDTLLCAPTGSGKTLAAFLWAIDRLSSTVSAASQVPGAASDLDAAAPSGSAVAAAPAGSAVATAPSMSGVRVLYISPLRALAVDIEKNLRAPIKGAEHAAARLGVPFTEPTIGLRTGDTTPKERSRLVRHPPDILITTPESLYLMLTSAARESLRSVETVIIDEIHALAPTKRGAHLALSLERLDQLITSGGLDRRRPQRIGLSATQRPLETVAGFLGGGHPVTIVDAGISKELDLLITVPVEDMSAESTIWPSIHPELLELVRTHRSTLIFVNSRRLAERLAAALNELDAETRDEEGSQSELVMAHHGSLSRERRLQVEDALKRGELRGLVATSSLELGIDMGAVDLVVQVESPGSVAAGLQRIGRAGHQVGVPSKGRILPKHSADLLEAAVVAQRMRDGQIETTRIPTNPLDVLAQQIVAACALDEWTVDTLFALCRGAANFASLSREQFENTLDMLAGRYPSEEFAELRPRVVWDRLDGMVRGRSGAQRLAVVSGGTIPDRGLFGVFLPDGSRVGELDEEMVYESRVGQTFILGASTWRIEEITFERVIVTPAPGQIGTMPFWHGDGPGRDAELGAAVGAFIRRLRTTGEDKVAELLGEDHSLDELAIRNVVRFVSEQAESTGVVPDDRTIVVERFRDEIGDWRVCIHSPYGARVHAPWAMVIRSRIDRYFDELGSLNPSEVIWSDDGIVLRLPEAAEDVALETIIPEPEEMDQELLAVLPSTAAFAARFREASARALLLPRRRPDQRTPLWQQRQRAADLLAVASKYPSFPMLLEATRECCNDYFDLPALRRLLSGVRSRSIRVVQVETPTPSPFARSLLFGWIAVFMYEGDAPLAERRAAALSLDGELLRDLLGSDELRSLLDATVIEEVESELQRLAEGRGARNIDEIHDLVRILGPLTSDEIAERTVMDSRMHVQAWTSELVSQRRVIAVPVGGEERFAAADDAGRLRDALGISVPIGLPATFTDPVDRPLGDLVERYARTRGPFTTAQVAQRLGITTETAGLILAEIVDSGRLLAGEFRPAHTEAEWCDPDVLRRIRRRSLAALRKEVEPVGAVTLTRFLCTWHGIPASTGGVDVLVEAIGRLQGASLPASALEADILGVRVRDYRPSDLDALCSSGELIWVGSRAVGIDDGRIRLAFRDQAAVVLGAFAHRGPDVDEQLVEPHHEAITQLLESRGASFWADIVRAVDEAGLPCDDGTVLEALWDLVWTGVVTADSFAPLRARIGGPGPGARSSARRDNRSSGRRSGRQSASGARSRRGPGANRRVAALGPPAGTGRWSLVAPLLDSEAPPNQTVLTMTRAQLLLERYGVLTREMALGEGIEGGFAGVYPLLRILEERGQVRRGYFVEGLGAAQFAQIGAADLLRASGDARVSEVRDPYMRRGAASGPAVVVLAATDPAQPYGAALRWPDSAGSPSRSIGAYVILVDGELAAYLERGGRKVLTFGASSSPSRVSLSGESASSRSESGIDITWVDGLVELVDSGRVRRLEIATVDGKSPSSSEWETVLLNSGFRQGYRGLTLG